MRFSVDEAAMDRLKLPSQALVGCGVYAFIAAKSAHRPR